MAAIDRADYIERILGELRHILAILHRRSVPPWNHYDLSMAQLKTLFALSCLGPVAVRDLAEQLGIGPPTASHLVDRLVSLGLVDRREDERDRRRTLVRLTPAGEALLQEIRQGNERHWRLLLERLDDHELAVLWEGVHALARVARHDAPKTSSTGEGV